MDHPSIVFCIVEGEDTSKAFPVSFIYDHAYVNNLKDNIKAATSPTFDAISARELTLWNVSVPVSRTNDVAVTLSNELVRQQHLRNYERKWPEKLHAIDRVRDHFPRRTKQEIGLIPAGLAGVPSKRPDTPSLSPITANTDQALCDFSNEFRTFVSRREEKFTLQNFDMTDISKPTRLSVRND
ncbi:hypothetical protein EDD21DRAFT_446097 [Dissophora ornata]|nr:hypothetical protein EDD21DRAFT_446097 [Dissophora ornata]